jgi:hypothetical protein
MNVLSYNSNSEFCQYQMFSWIYQLYVTSLVVIFKFHSNPSVNAEREKGQYISVKPVFLWNKYAFACNLSFPVL